MEILIGCKDVQGNPLTKGTGFIVQKNERKFVVTCRHVAEQLIGNQIFGITDCRKYVFPRLNDYVLSLVAPIYHPNDSAVSSYDVAVFEVSADQSSNLQNYNAVAYEALTAVEDSKVIISGYSVPYLNTHFDPNCDELLAPERLNGHVETQPLDLLRSSGFGFNIKEYQFINCSQPIYEGTSGGPIWQGVNCVGMLIASVNASWNYPDGRSVPILGGAFVPALRIKETIDSIH